MRRTFFATVLVASASTFGCNSAPEEALSTSSDRIATGTVVEPRGGSRLRAVYGKVGGATLVTGVFHDTKLDEDCSFVPTLDGYRCLPTGARTGVHPTGGATSFWFDSACSDLGVGIYKYSANATKHIRVMAEAGAACGYRAGVVEIGAPRSAARVFMRANGACVEISLAADYTTFSARPVALGDYVAAREDRVPAGGDLAVARLRAEDGSVSSVGTLDARRGVFCGAGVGARCVPTMNAYFNNTFVEGTCFERGAPWSSTSGWGDSCTPSAIVDYTNACNPSYFEVGAATQQGLWFKSGASCLAQGAVSTQTTYRLGAPIFLDSFPAMTTRTKQVGAATVRETASSTGALLYTEIMDVARDRACYAQRTDDGKARCIPVAELSFADDFADSSCSAPIVRVGYYECTTVLRPRLAQHYLTRALYETGTSKFHGQTFRRFDGVCRPYVESDYYEIVRTVAPSEFPEVTLHEDTLDESSSGGSSNGGSSSGGSSNGGSSNGGSSNGLENGSSPGGSSDDGTQGESLSSSSSGDVEIHKVTTGCSTTPAGRSSNGALALVMAMAIGGLVGALVRRRPR